MKIKTTMEQIVDYLTSEIFVGKYHPGDKISEKDISKLLGVSRTPIREAFRVLEMKGLLEGTSNKGMRVPMITIEDLDEIFEIRLLIEIHCIKKFTRNIVQKDIHDIKKVIDQMKKSSKEKNYLNYFNNSIKFHVLYMDRCQNKRLLDAFSLLRNSIQCAQLLFRENPISYHASIKEHEEMFAAMKDREADECAKLLKRHLEANHQRMKKGLKTIMERDSST